jgi:hypothetical protein
MNSKHPIDELFKNKLENHEVAPSADLWNRVEGQLEQKEGGTFSWKAIAAAVVFVLASGAFFYIENQGARNFEKPTDLPTMQPVTVAPTTTPATIIKQAPTDSELSEARKEMAEVYSGSSQKTVSTERQTAQFDFEDSYYEPIELYEQPMIVAEARVEKASKNKLNISINPEKYTMADASFGEELNSYTNNQLDNISSGKSLEAPPLEKVTWKNISKGISSLFAQEDD